MTTWRGFPTAGTLDAGADHPAGAVNDFQFGQVDLIGLWFRIRVPCIATVGVPILLFGLAWGSVRLLLAVALAAPLVVDAVLRSRRSPGKALLVVLMDQTAFAGALILLGAPRFTVIAFALYYVVVAASVLRASSLAAALCWNVVTVTAVVVAGPHIPPALTPTRATTLGIVSVVLFGAMLLGQVVLLEKVVSRYHSTRDAHWQNWTRSRDQFLDGVSHALRTPLTGVLGFGRVLAQDEGLAMSPETRQVVSDLNLGAEELSMLVEDLIVRAEDGTSAVRLVPVAGDLRAITAHVIAGSVRLWPGKVLSLMGDPAVPVFADAARTRLVVRHLISNAIRHGGDHIVAEVTRGTRATLVVRDDGLGLPEGHDILAESASWRGDPDRSSPSMGLGLQVSKRLAGLMGGTLTCDRVGAETLFRLTLPSAFPLQA